MPVAIQFNWIEVELSQIGFQFSEHPAIPDLFKCYTDLVDTHDRLGARACCPSSALVVESL